MIRRMLSNNKTIFRIYMNVRTLQGYWSDFRNYVKYGMASRSQGQENRYAMAILCHAIEKGLCHENPRAFGEEKIIELIDILENHHESLEPWDFGWAASVVSEWVYLCDENDFCSAKTRNRAHCFLEAYALSSVVNGGAKSCMLPNCAEDRDAFDRVVMSRTSMRRYSDKTISQDVFIECARHFLYAPTACNRQMCRLHWVKSQEGTAFLRAHLRGLSGFDTDKVEFFIVSFDLASLRFAGERNQGYLNAGLCAMNFVNALHSRGIGSTFIEWYESPKENDELKIACELDASEVVAVVIGAGYYPEFAVVPDSPRRPISEIVKIVGSEAGKVNC